MSGDEFHWLRPLWFLLLPLLGWLAWRLRHHVQGGYAWAARICDPHLLPHLLQQGLGGGTSGRLPLILLAMGWLLAVLALAGPVWQRLPQPLYQKGSVRVVLLDLSYSMNAADLTPSRLERARYKILDLLRRDKEGEVALIAYAGEPHVVAPLTSDAATLAALIPVLSPEVMPVAGSRPALALALADRMLDEAGHARGGELLLITDGIDETGAVAEALRPLVKKGRRLSILGVGTPQGAPVPRPDKGFFADEQGKAVVAKLVEDPLLRLAHAGGGVYRFMSADASDLKAILAVGAESSWLGEKNPNQAMTADQWREEGPWLVVLILPLAALAFRRGWLGVVILAVWLTPATVRAEGWGDPWRNPDQQGVRLLEQGEVGAAAERFTDPRWQGTALYRAGDFAAAAEKFAQVDDAEAHYNRGNALARAQKLEEAVTAYERALAQNADHADARHNLDLVKKLLEQKKEEQKKDEKKKDEKKKDEEKKDGQKKDEEKKDEEKKDEGGASEQGEGQQEGEKEAAAPARQDEKGEPSQGKDSAEGAPDDPKEQGASPGDGDKKEETGREQSPSAPVEQGKDEPKTPEQASPAMRPLTPEEGEKDPSGGEAQTQGNTPGEREKAQATRQWLRRIPEDPGGLLREKFRRQAQRRAAEGKPSYSGQPW